MSAERTDLVVVGAGPAGLAATATALLGGLRVTLVDAGSALGGQFWRHPPDGATITGIERFHHALGTYRALRATLGRYAASGLLDVRLEHHAWTVATGRNAVDVHVDVHVLDRSAGPGTERASVIRARHLLVATGAFDRQLPFPGWDLPGVFTAGGLQALLKGNGVTVPGRVVVAGTGPFLLPVATGLVQAGAQVVAVCEAADPVRWARHAPVVAQLPVKAAEGAGYAARLLRHRVPVRVRTAVVAAHGRDRVEAVTLARLDKNGAPLPQTQEQVRVDVVGTGWGFVPQLDLARTLGCRLSSSADGNEVVSVDQWQRTSVPGVSAAGEACGVGGAELALREGQLAAEGILADLGRAGVTGPAALRRVRGLIARHRAFAAAMAHVHALPPGWTGWLDDATTVCRCEEVRAGTVRAAVAAGAADGRQVKQLTRAGMGWCQGRMCATAIEWLARAGPSGAGAVGVEPFPAVERLVAAPVTLGALAALEGAVEQVVGPGATQDDQ